MTPILDHEMHSDLYSLLPGDLRDPDSLINQLRPLLDSSAPTLIIAELVLVYLSPQHAESLLRKLLEGFFTGPVMLVSYEALDLGDSFSRVMVQNLDVRAVLFPSPRSNQHQDKIVADTLPYGRLEG